MNLLIVSQYFWPENFKINDLVAAMVARGHDVTVLTGVPTYPDRSMFASFDSNSVGYSEYEGARIVRVPLMRRGGGLRLALNYFSFAVSATVLGAWKLRGISFDRIFVYEPSPITVGIPGIALRRIKSAPVALWVQDLWPETLEALGTVTSPLLLRLVRALVRFIYKRCDLILAQSQSFVPFIAAHCDRRAQIMYLPNWADPTCTEPQNLAPEVPVAEGVFTVMFTGNIGDAQNFPAILDAAERLKSRRDIRWIIVGDGRMSDYVSAEVARRGLHDSVLMPGRFSMDRMPSFYQHADALLVSLKPDPILAATIPAKVQAYLATGLPIVAMMDGEGAHVIELAKAGFVHPAGDFKGLATAVLELAMLSPAERGAMGERGRRFASLEFDRARQIEKLERWLLGLSAPASVRRAKPT